MRGTYLVTPADTRVPAVRIGAVDVVDLGQQVAVHLTRHRRLSRGVPYDAHIGDDHGAIRQGRQVLTFTIRKEDR